MKCFVNVKTKREFEIFLNYCEKNDVVFCSGRKVLTYFRKSWLDTGVTFYFDNDKFNHLSYSSIGYGEKFGCKKISFKDIFMKNNYLDIE